MRKVFFVSREFPFDRVIYPGSGPEFGRAYGWDVRSIDEMPAAACDVGIVENRLRPGDVENLERFLGGPAGAPFPILFKISDPEMPLSRDEGARWIFAQGDRPGVHFASVYEPAGPVRDYFAGLSRSRVVRAPFPYDRAREVGRPMEGRARRVFLSGKRDRRLYPLRESLFRRRTWNPVTRAVVTRLRHPGYPDLGARPRHDLIREKFVARAAGHTHFFLDGSRYRVELMKYLECAYAGCVPLGEVPPSLEADVASCFVRSAGGALDLIRAIRAPLRDIEALAGAYRRAVRAARDPRRLDAALDEQVRDLARA